MYSPYVSKHERIRKVTKDGLCEDTMKYKVIIREPSSVQMAILAKNKTFLI